jgi:hypothetical protein
MLTHPHCADFKSCENDGSGPQNKVLKSEARGMVDSAPWSPK